MIQLYIATSLDGYIARKDGNLDWLNNFPNPNQIDYGYTEFYAGIDTVILGRKTYDEILGFGVDWPYTDSTTYVLSTNTDYPIQTPNTQLLSDLSEEIIQNLRSQSQKNIWLVGGGNLVTQFLNLNAIDEIILTLIPVIIGEGLPLFPNSPKESTFDLLGAKSFDTGAVSLHYSRKKQ